tara:strand:- start:3639 stop:4283 length:645 start_codon:yes stop_codon:yes gene_type:complete
MLLYIPAAIPVMPEIDHSMLPPSEYGPPTEDGTHCWEMKKLVRGGLDDQGLDSYSYKEIVNEFQLSNPDFMEWTKCLPYKEWINIKIHYQHRSQGVPVHVDLLQPGRDLDHYHHLHFNEPAGYRVIMSGALNDVTYLWNEKKEKVYCNMPTDGSTNTYIMNYTTAMHGVDADTGRGILFFQFTLDENKHHKIIQDSIKKYNDYAVRIKMDEKYG